MTAPQQAISISPSQGWDGNDGQWSTFAIQIGNPPQSVRLLPSTSQSAIWPVTPEGCVSGQDPDECPISRGYTFNLSNSSTFERDGQVWQLPLQPETALGYAQNTIVGLDNVTLGWGGSGAPALSHQAIMGLAAKDIYIGMIGLSFRPVNISSFNDQHPSALTSLRNANMTPSLTFGYTAGSYYVGAFGSLTLGGYDIDRCDSTNNITAPLGVDSDRDLVISISSIAISNTTISPPSANFDAYIDSTIPEIWLPVPTCLVFEQAFGLEWNSDLGIYLLNDTQHASLLAQNSAVTLTLAAPNAPPTGSATVNITLPYSSFDLVARYPLLGENANVNSSSLYFPLKRAQNETQYYLGRTFLQNAYLFVDYERSEFTVSQARFPPNPATSNLIPVFPPSIGPNIVTSTSSLATPTSSTSAPPNSLKNAYGNSTSHTGTIVGIGVGASICVMIVVIGIWLLIWRPRHQLRRRKAVMMVRLNSNEQDTGNMNLHATHSELHGTQGGIEIDGKLVGAEMMAASIGESPARHELPSRYEGAELGRTSRLSVRQESNLGVKDLDIRPGSNVVRSTRAPAKWATYSVVELE